jgi:iron complex transport system ATP-binding protein
MSSAPILEFEHVDFQYSNTAKLVLDDFSLSLPEGAVSAILGPNGSGKTTLMRLAYGKEKPLHGSIRVHGRDMKDYSRRELGQWIGLVPQNEYLHYDYTLLEYTVLGRAPYLEPLAMPGEEDFSIASQALVRVGLGEMQYRPVTRLSGGELQLALVARALTQQPKLMLLDEPTSHLDLANKRKLIDILRELAVQGMTIIFTTHEPEAAASIASHLVLMRPGRVLFSGNLNDGLTNEQLSSAYGVPVRVIKVDGLQVVTWQ